MRLDAFIFNYLDCGYPFVPQAYLVAQIPLIKPEPEKPLAYHPFLTAASKDVSAGISA
jgi:hypothetical protein